MQNRAERVLLLVTQADWGGVQSFLCRFASELLTEGRTVLLAAGGEGELWEEARKRGIPTVQLRHMRRELSPIQDVLAIKELKQLIREFKPDAVHLNSSKMGVLGSIAASSFPKKPWTVYRIGGWSFLEPMPGWKSRLYREAEIRTAKKKDVILTVHPGDERLARELGIKSRRLIRTVPNGLDLEPFESNLLPREEARQTLHLSPDALVFGTVANAYATKGLLPYLRSADRMLREIPEAQVAILGDGPELEALVRLAETLPSRDRIHLYGHVDGATRLYRAFDAFVLPSKKEGMPWALLEAMASGLPCLATDVGACRWMLTDFAAQKSFGTVIPSGDRTALEAGLLTLAKDEALRQEQGKNARRLVAERFTWRATLEGQRNAIDFPFAQGLRT